MIFLLPLFILMITQQTSGMKLKKCCPYNEVVSMDTLDDNLLSHRDIFHCVSAHNHTQELEINFNNFSLIGYNTLVDHDSHWPACEEMLSFKALNERQQPLKRSQSASCVDMMTNDKYFVFTCDARNREISDDFVEIVKLKKCCPLGKSYDIFRRRCVENDGGDVDTDIDSKFHDLLHKKVAIFEYEKINCKDDEVLIEYHSHVHGLKIYAGSLILTKGGRDFGPEVVNTPYCIEATSNSEVDKPNGMIEEHFINRATSKFVAKVCREKSLCNSIPCVQKCCLDGERMTNDGNSTYCEEHDLDLEMKFHSFNKEQSEMEPQALEPMEYGILRHKSCEKYILSEEEDGLYFHSGIDGSLFTPKFEKFYTHEEYCVDYFYFKDEEYPDVDVQLHTFVCFNDEEHAKHMIQFHIYATLLAISAFFLGLTLVVYLFLPKLLNLHGKTVVCHVISLLLGYTFLSAVQFSTDVRLPFCLCIAFIVYFGLLSAFSWLNVMCLDIFWTFGSIRASHGIRRTKEMKRFMYYSLYAWGFPFVMTLFTFMIDFYDVLPTSLRPNIGRTKCWFQKQSSPGHLIFFLLPIGIQISVNFVLFVLTAIHCNRIKAEIHRMQTCDNSDQQKKKSFIADKAIFIMNIKLFSVMGISWLLEIMATLYKQHSTWWYISDVFNCLQGVLVFFVFVFKRKVLVAFQKKLGIRKVGLRQKATPGSTTLSTLDVNSTSASSRYNTRMMTKSSSAATLNTTLIKN